ncbi:unnamed protein product [Lepidochelys kempii]
MFVFLFLEETLRFFLFVSFFESCTTVKQPTCPSRWFPRGAREEWGRTATLMTAADSGPWSRVLFPRAPATHLAQGELLTGKALLASCQFLSPVTGRPDASELPRYGPPGRLGAPPLRAARTPRSSPVTGRPASSLHQAPPPRLDFFYKLRLPSWIFPHKLRPVKPASSLPRWALRCPADRKMISSAHRFLGGLRGPFLLLSSLGISFI